MATRSNSFVRMELAGASLEAIRQLVRKAEMKLADLQARRAQIRKRIRALHHLSSTFAPEGAISVDGLEKVSERDCPTLPKTAILNDAITAQSVSQTSRSSPLRRACRIALMECEEPASVDHILNRIRERGSASVTDLEDPLGTVTRELYEMFADREVKQRFAEGKPAQWELNRGC